jgi:hypothetical protein
VPWQGKRPSLSEDVLLPKPPSDSFKAKRAQHYNEAAAIRAFKQGCKAEGTFEPSTESSGTSDEGDPTETNTNTNINQTTSVSSRISSKGGSDTDRSDFKSSERGYGTSACATSVDLAATCKKEDAVEAQLPAVVKKNGHFADGQVATRQHQAKRPSFEEAPPKKEEVLTVSRGIGGECAATDWHEKRKAHYAGIAAAMRNVPPPSDDEEDDSD